VGKPSVTPGRFVLQDSKSLYLIDSEDLLCTFDQFYSEAITTILNIGYKRELSADVWHEYQHKQ